MLIELPEFGKRDFWLTHALLANKGIALFPATHISTIDKIIKIYSSPSELYEAMTLNVHMFQRKDRSLVFLAHDWRRVDVRILPINDTHITFLRKPNSGYEELKESLRTIGDNRDKLIFYKGIV